MKLRHFLTSKIFFLQLAIAILLTAALLWFTMWELKTYTHHGEEIPVPDFTGMTLNESQKVVQENRLKYKIMDSIYRPNKLPGTILDQSPAPGFGVKRNRTIFFTINANNPEKVRFPKLISTSFRQAIAILETNGFKIGHLEYVPSDYRNLVLQQKCKGDTIVSGSLIEKGATIDLVLGTGKNASPILVPTLIGQQLYEARENILSSNLNMGNIIYDNSISSKEDSIKAKVWKQEPTFGENIKVQPGDEINIWLTIDGKRLFQADSLRTVKLEKVGY